MLIKCIRNNFKVIFRDPVSLLALIAALIMFITTAYHQVWLDFDSSWFYRADAQSYLANSYAHNDVTMPVKYLVFPFIGVIIAAHFFKDKKTGFSDILNCGQMSYLKYYLSKIIVYTVISFAFCFIITAVEITFQIIAYVPQNPNFSYSWLFLRILRNMAIIYPVCLPLSVAIPVFIVSLSGVPAAAAVFNIGYYYIPFVISSYKFGFLYNYIHVVPWKLTLLTSSYTWREVPNSVSGPTASYTFAETRLAVIVQLAFAALLFIAGYFISKRRYRQV